MSKQFIVKIILPASKDKPWYDKDCRLANKEQRRLYRKWHKLNDYMSREAYLQAKRCYQKLYNENKNEYFILQQMSLTNVRRNPSAFWFVVKRLKPRKSSVRPIARETLEKFYEDIYPSRDTSFEIYDCRYPTLDNNFTYEVLGEVLMNLKCNKAPGPDRVPNAFYQNLPGK